MLLLLFLQPADDGSTPPPTPPAPAPTPGKKGKGRALGHEKFKYRYVVELGEDKHYFWSEQEALDFLAKRSEQLKRQAKAVARKTHRIELPKGAAPIPLPQVSPVPRFVVVGNDAIAQLSQRINAQIDAILADPDYEARMDDEDLARLLDEADF